MTNDPIKGTIESFQRLIRAHTDRKESEQRYQQIVEEMEEWKRVHQAEHDEKIRKMNEEADRELQKMHEDTMRKLEALHAKWDPIIERNERELAKFEEKYGKRT